MTASLPFPTRYLAAIGVLALLAGAFLVARPLLTSDDSSSTAAPVASTRQKAAARSIRSRLRS